MELEKDETLDDLLTDGMMIYQSKKLYRFTSDAVLLSKFADYKNGEIVADLCSGAGIVGLNYYVLHKETKKICSFELQKGLHDLFVKTVKYNGLESVIFPYNTPVQEIPSAFKGEFSLVLCNPPYKKENSGIVNPEESDALARHELKITFAEIVSAAEKLLKRGGRFCACQRIERLPEVFSLMQNAKLNPSRLRLISGGADKKPYLFLIEGVKGVNRQFKVEPLLIN